MALWADKADEPSPGAARPADVQSRSSRNSIHSTGVVSRNGILQSPNTVPIGFLFFGDIEGANPAGQG